MDAHGQARITDFCLATVTTNVDSELSTLLLRSNTLRWTAPEVMNGGKYSREADIFSLAMVMIEVRHWRLTVHGALAYRRFVSIHADILPGDSFQGCFVVHGHVGDNAGKAPTTADISDFHGKSVDADATLLG